MALLEYKDYDLIVGEKIIEDIGPIDDIGTIKQYDPWWSVELVAFLGDSNGGEHPFGRAHIGEALEIIVEDLMTQTSMDDFLDVANIISDTGGGSRVHETMKVEEHEVRVEVLLMQLLIGTIEPS